MNTNGTNLRNIKVTGGQVPRHLYLAELIVLQVLKEEKDAYEQYLITDVCNLYHVLRILSANDGDMSDKNRETLKKRVIAEWEYEKRLSQQYKEQTEFLDGYLMKVLK